MSIVPSSLTVAILPIWGRDRLCSGSRQWPIWKAGVLPASFPALHNPRIYTELHELSRLTAWHVPCDSNVADGPNPFARQQRDIAMHTPLGAVASRPFAR